MKRSFLATVTLATLAFAASPAGAAIFIPGSLNTLTATNAPVSFTCGLQVGFTGICNAGNMQVSETVTPDGPNAAWLTVNYTVNPGTLLGNPSLNWEVNVNGIQLSAPAIFDKFTIYWTQNGTPYSPIVPFGGIGGVESDPLGGGFPVYSGTTGSITPITTLNNLFTSVAPWSFINSGLGSNGVNATDFHEAAHVTLVSSVAVPEPGTLGLLGSMLLSLGLMLWRRRNS